MQLNLSQLQSSNLSSDQLIDLQQGELDKNQVQTLHPIYQIKGSKNDNFYLYFSGCLQTLSGNQNKKYQQMKSRIQKYFIKNDYFQRGYRWNKRIQPDYSNISTYPLCHCVLLYGVDFLSNKQLKKLLKLDLGFKNIIRLNWSNACIIFQNKIHMEQIIKPFLYQQEKYPFFLPKVQQDEQEENININIINNQNNNNIIDKQQQRLKKLPRKWYGLRSYMYKQQHMHWFIRYLTNIQIQKLKQIKLSAQFDQVYDTAKKIYKKKQKNKEDYQNSSLNSSSLMYLSSNRITERERLRSNYTQSRQRSREKTNSMKNRQTEMVDDNYQDLGQPQRYKQSQAQGSQYDNYINSQSGLQPIKGKQLLDKSMSFIYDPIQQTQIDSKKQSDRILQMFQRMNINKQSLTVSKISDHLNLLQQEDDMQIITKGYDPMGLNDKLLSQKAKEIDGLTELKPFEKFNYREYVEKMEEVEQHYKKKKNIPIIVLE